MMKKISKLFLVFLFFLLVCSFCSLSVIAKSSNEIELQDEFNADAVYLYSYDAKRVLYSSSKKEELMPASTVKMMTGLLVCERYSDRLDENITVSEEMLKDTEGTSMGIRSGMILSIKELLYGTICGGNNDAATVLAIACSDSTSAFVDEMNRYARLLDMRNTVYVNPTGLDALGAKTTLDDVIKLAAKAAESKLYLDISSTTSYTVNQNITIYNRNALISQFSAQGYINKNARGLIAGSTDKGGYVVATYAEKNGSAFLCVVMGAAADAQKIYSYDIANRLIDYAFKHYRWKVLCKANDHIAYLDVDLAITNENNSQIACVLENDVSFFLPKDVDGKEISRKIYFHDKKLTAPIKSGTVLGGVGFYYKGNLLGSARIIAENDIEANSLLVILNRMKNFFLSGVFWVGFIISLPALIAYISFENKQSRYKKVSTIQYKKFY